MESLLRVARNHQS